MQEMQLTDTEKSTVIQEIPIKLISPNPNQPRKSFSEDSIIKLASSIKEYGIIQPLTVRKAGTAYELVAGERRLRAAKELGMAAVPCIELDITEESSAEISIIENLLREDLNIFEQASAIEALIDTYGLTQEQVAKKLSNSQSFVANKLRLLRLSKEEQEVILNNKLTERHARALLRVYNQEERRNLLNFIVENTLNVSNTEKLIESFNHNKQILPLSSVPNQKEAPPTNSKEPTILQDAPSKREHSTYKDPQSFCQAINRAINSANTSNLGIKSRKIVGDTFIEITIFVPKTTGDTTAENANEQEEAYS